MTEAEFWAMGRDDGGGVAAPPAGGSLTEEEFWGMSADAPAEEPDELSLLSPAELAMKASEDNLAHGIDPYQANLQAGAEMQLENNPRGFLTGNVFSRMVEGTLDSTSARAGSLIGRAANFVDTAANAARPAGRALDTSGPTDFGTDMVIANQGALDSDPALQSQLNKRGLLGETVTSWLQAAGSMAGEAALVGSFGGGPTSYALWLGSTTYDKKFDDTGSHKQALAAGLIETAFTMVTGKFLGTGTVAITEKLSGKPVSKSLAGRVAKYLSEKSPVPRPVAEGVSGSFAEVFNEGLTEGSHYFADIALTDKDFDKNELIDRVSEVIGPSLIAGGGGRVVATAEIRSTAKQIADFFDKRQKAVKPTAEAIAAADKFAEKNPEAAQKLATAEGYPSRTEFGRTVQQGKKGWQTSREHREAFVDELRRKNDELSDAADESTEEGPVEDLSGPRTETQPLTDAEKYQLARDIDGLAVQNYTTRQDAEGKRVRDETYNPHEDTIAKLHALAETQPELAQAIVQRAYQEAAVENDRLSNLQDQIDSVMRASGTSPTKARGIAARGDDETFISGYDQSNEQLADDYPELAAEARKAGGLPELIARGRKQFDRRDVAEFIELPDDITLPEQAPDETTQAEPAMDDTPEFDLGPPPDEVSTEPAPADLSDSKIQPALNRVLSVQRGLKHLSDVNGTEITEAQPETDDQLEALEFLRSRGHEPVFYRGKGDVRTAGMSHEGIIYVRADKQGNALWEVVGHELAHTTEFDLRSKADRDLVEAAAQRRLNNATDRYRTMMEEDPTLRQREGLAQLAGEALSDPAFRQQLARKHPSLWRQIVEAITKLFKGYDPKSEFAKELLAELRSERSAEPAAALLTEDPTSTKNAVEDAERTRLNLPPAMQPTPESVNQWDTEAKEILRRNPDAGKQIVEAVLESKRSVSERENMVVLNYKTRILNERNKIAADHEHALRTGDLTAAAELASRADQLGDELLAIMEANKLAFTEWGRAGVARQQGMTDDFSIANLEAMMRMTVGGRKLTAAENAEIARLSKENADLKAKLAQAELAAAAKASRESHTRLSNRAKHMKKGQPKPDTSKVTPDSTSVELSNLARQLYLHYLQQGMTTRDAIIDKVHADLAAGMPDLTRRETMDAVSLYGQFTELNKDPNMVKLREHAGEMQQIAKLLDMEQGKAPLKTGREQRTRSDEERRLERLVNEAKKKYNIQPTDPARSLASALGAFKTRMRNEITDLGTQIKNRQKFVKNKTDLKKDAEAERLQAQRDALREQFNEIFGVGQMTDAKRLELSTKAVERNIAELERRIKEGDFASNGRPPLTNKALEALKAKRDSLRHHFQELKANDPASQIAAEQRATLALQRRIGNRMAQLSVKMAVKDFDPKGRKHNRPMDEATAQFQDALDKLSEKWEGMLWEKRTERRLQQRITAANDQLATEGKLPPKETRVLREMSPELERLQYQADRAARKVEARRRMEQPMTRWQKVADAANFIKALKTSLDLSSLLRQGGFIGFGNPIRAGKAFVKTFPTIWSESKAKEIDEEIHNRPNAPRYGKSKLFFSDNEGSLNAQEEAFMSKAARNFPGIKHSQRAYTSFLNLLRADSFDAMARSFSDGKPNIELDEDISAYINDATGRGHLGEKGEAAGPILSTIFFSTRFTVSRFSLLFGRPITRARSAEARKLIAKEYGKTLTGMAVVYALAMAAGADVEENPLKADFGKIRWGKTRIDPLMGLQQTAVVTSRVADQLIATVSGRKRKFGEDQVVERFLRSKLAPAPGIAVSMIKGAFPDPDKERKKITIGRLLEESFKPLVFNDLLDTMEEQGVPRGTALMLLQFFGMGLQTYDDKSTSADN